MYKPVFLHKSYYFAIASLSALLLLCLTISFGTQVEKLKASGQNNKEISTYQRLYLYLQKNEAYKIPHQLTIEQKHEADLFFIKHSSCIHNVIVNDRQVGKPQTCIEDKHGYIWISPYLHKGTNRVYLSADADYSSVAVDVITTSIIWILAGLLSLIILFLLLLSAIVIQNTHYVMIAGLSVAFACFFIFFTQTHYWEYSHDVSGHIEYIDYIINHHEIPKPTSGWVFYHPPLYYMIAAVIKGVGDYFGDTNLNALRMFSMLLYTGFLYYSFQILNIMIRRKDYIFFLGVIMLFMWPTGFMMASRVDNSALFYFLATASFYYLLIWYYQEVEIVKSLAISVTLFALAMLTRTNSMILIPLILTAVVYKSYIRKYSISLVINRQTLLALIILLVCISINFGRNIEERLSNNTNLPWIVGNTLPMQNWDIYVDNKLSNYLTLDYKSYIDTTYFHAQQNEGRKNFWVVFVKTFVTGEKVFEDENGVRALNLLILIIFALVTLPVIFYKKSDFENIWPMLMMTFTSIAALLFNRWNSPVWTSADFRYIVPVLPACIALFVYNLQHIKWVRPRFILNIICAFSILFIFLSIKIYIYQWA